MTPILAKAMELMEQIDSDLKPTDPGYPETLLLLVSANLGTDDDMLAETLGYDSDFVATVGSRLRSAGIWTADGIAEKHRETWDEMGFFADAAVACGNMKVVGDSAGGPLYSLTDQGRRSVERMIER